MVGENNVSTFEALSAELLAANSSDHDVLLQIAANLANAAELLDPSSPAKTLATTAGQITLQITAKELPDSDAALAHLAEAMMALHLYLQDKNNQNKSAIEASLKLMQQIQSSASPGSASPAIPSPKADTLPDIQNTTLCQSDSQQIEGDLELLNDFISEALDHIATAESALLTLETGADDIEQINTILRAFHTIKGASAFLGLDKIHNLAHLAENHLARARDGEIRISGQYADWILQSCDALKEMIVSLQNHQVGTPCQTPDNLDELLRNLSDPQISKNQSNDSDSLDEAQKQPTAKTSTDNQITDSSKEQSDAADSDHNAEHHTASTIRVATKRLDDLVDMVGELVIAQSMVSQSPEILEGKNRQFVRSVSHTGKIVRELQDLAMSLRMVPLKSTFAKMHRLTRDLSHKSGKSVQLATSGDSTEIDRNMVETLTDPLVHMIRNAVDHGIESQQQRSQAGKKPTGTISLRAYHTAGNVVIEVQDDGKGIDTQRIVKKAADRGLTSPNSELTNEQALSMIFQPGFSTAKQVTEVSGRGVGMDVVRRNIALLRGRVEVSSQPECGTTFRICLPLTTAIADAILVRIGSQRFLLPTLSIERSFRPEPGSISHVAQSGEIVMFRDELLPVFRLHRLFDIEAAATDPYQALLVVVTGSGTRCALMVDELLNHQQAVIKSLDNTSEEIQGTAGAAILGDGRVALILDTDSLVNLALRQTPTYSLDEAVA